MPNAKRQTISRYPTKQELDIQTARFGLSSSVQRMYGSLRVVLLNVGSGPARDPRRAAESGQKQASSDARRWSSVLRLRIPEKDSAIAESRTAFSTPT